MMMEEDESNTSRQDDTFQDEDKVPPSTVREDKLLENFLFFL